MSAALLSIAAPARAMIAWGDVHAHSGFSDDASGDPSEFFRIARDVIGLDFVVLSDHDVHLTSEEWRTAKEAADEFDEPGRFIAFAGVEWSHAWHMNFYFGSDPGEICGGGGGPACDSGSDAHSFYGARVIAGEGAAHVNHPHPLLPVRWEQVWNDVATNVEMWNSLWSFNVGPDLPELWFGGAIWALQVGFRFGFVGASDDHFVGRSDFYLLGTGLTACKVEELSRAAIVDALRNRRCYASNGSRALLDFDVGGVPMGGELDLPLGSTPTAKVAVTAPTVPTRIELVQNGHSVAHRVDCRNRTCALSVPLGITDEYNFVYAKVYEGNRFRTWSTPVWVRGTCGVSADCPRDRPLPEGGDPATSCLAAWRVLPGTDRDDEGRPRRRSTCTTGDVRCDIDVDPASCTFQVGLCLGVEEGRHPSCAMAPVQRFDVRANGPRNVRRSNGGSRNERTLAAAAQALRSAPPGRCSPYVPVRVPLRRLPDGRLARSVRNLTLRTEVAGRHDIDRLELVCLPPG